MKVTITSGIIVNDTFYAKASKCSPKLCSLASQEEFNMINKIPPSGVPSGSIPMVLTTGCVGNLTLLNNTLESFETSELIYNKEYEIFPICISGILFGQVSN